MRLDLIGVDVRRGATLAASNVTFTVAAGSWLGVVGANGSGKTSLLRAVAGRLDLAGGLIMVDGIDRSADRAWRARAIGFAPDAASLPGRPTAAQLYTLLGGGADERAALVSLRSALGIDGLRDHRIDTLSSGNRQRIALYAAFVAPEPRRAVILDEPFNWLDPVAAYDLKQAMAGLVADGLTLMTALHDLGSWVMLCDHGVMLTDGRIAAELTAVELAAGRGDLAAFEHRMITALRAR